MRIAGSDFVDPNDTVDLSGANFLANFFAPLIRLPFELDDFALAESSLVAPGMTLADFGEVLEMEDFTFLLSLVSSS